jgi:hypothetical protein
VIFYLTPVDEQTGESLLPGEFRPLVKSNVRLLERELRTTGATVLDLSDGLPAESFSWDLYPNEHLRAAGRRYVAHQLEQAIVPQLASGVDYETF